jgi:hypothetical protein
MINFSNTGDFSKTFNFLNNVKKDTMTSVLESFGQEGVTALSANTPKDSGETANCWSYKIEKSNGQTKISWYNSNVINGVSIAIILQYGHGTKNGGYVEGRDYINPAMKPIFDKIADRAWKEVINR